MKLWGGRFTKETNELVNNFNASISFDQKFYKQDIQGSIAHATMLAAQGIISEDEGKQITDGLKGILSDIESGKLEITDEYEDIHTFMELLLLSVSVMQERSFTQAEAVMTRLHLICDFIHAMKLKMLMKK